MAGPALPFVRFGKERKPYKRSSPQSQARGAGANMSPGRKPPLQQMHEPHFISPLVPRAPRNGALRNIARRRYAAHDTCAMPA